MGVVGTYEDDLVIQDHRSISSVGIRDRLHDRVFREQRLLFQDSGNVTAALTGLMLASSKMAVDETHGGVINDKPTDDSALVHSKYKFQRKGMIRSPCYRTCHPYPSLWY